MDKEGNGALRGVLYWSTFVAWEPKKTDTAASPSWIKSLLELLVTAATPVKRRKKGTNLHLREQKNEDVSRATFPNAKNRYFERGLSDT